MANPESAATIDTDKLPELRPYSCCGAAPHRRGWRPGVAGLRHADRYLRGAGADTRGWSRRLGKLSMQAPLARSELLCYEDV